MNNLRQFMGSLPHKGWLGVLLVSWVALFHLLGNSSFGYVNTESAFVWLYRWYQLPTIGESGDELCPLVPAVVGVLLYLRRAQIQAAVKQPWFPGVFLLTLGLALHVFGYLAQQVRLSLVGFIIGSGGLIAGLWGRELLKVVAGPILFLIFAIPMAAYTDGLTFHLRLIVTKLAVGVCQTLLAMPIEQAGTTVSRLPTALSAGFKFDVAPACSGIRSMLAVLFVTTVFVHLNRRRWWHSLLLLAAATPLALVGNTIRLVFVFLMGDALGEEVGKAVETKFGFITYAAALIGILVIDRLILRRRPPATAAEGTPATA